MFANPHPSERRISIIACEPPGKRFAVAQEHLVPAPGLQSPQDAKFGACWRGFIGLLPGRESPTLSRSATEESGLWLRVNASTVPRLSKKDASGCRRS